MDTITYSAARASLAATMEKVCQDREPLIITRSGQQSVVLLSLDDFKSLEETALGEANQALRGRPRALPR